MKFELSFIPALKDELIFYAKPRRFKGKYLQAV